MPIPYFAVDFELKCSAASIRSHLWSYMSALSPVPRHSPLVADRKHRRDITLKHVVYGVGKVAQEVVPNVVLVGGPPVGRIAECINGFERFAAECTRSKWTSLEIPKKCFADLCLGWRQNFNSKARQSLLSRARASAQGAGLSAPSRSACLRCRSSLRQASDIEASALPSKLSSSATTRADLSSAGRPKASVSSWSTRAFMSRSLPFAVLACQQRQ